MSRYFLAIGSLAILSLACSLGGSETSEQESPEDSPSSGGVPISKATSAPPVDNTDTPSQVPQATSQTQPTRAPTLAPPQDNPDPGDVPLAIADLNIAGSESSPRLIGLIQNIGNSPLKSIRVTATFYDADGNEVEESLGAVTSNVVPPGGISPFEMFFPRGVPPSVDSVVTTIEWTEAEASDPWTTEGLEISDISSGMSFTNFEISGTLRNTSSKMAEFISLIPIAYNADGKFIGSSLKVIEDLEAGSSAPFTVAIGDGSRAEPTVDHYELIYVVRYEE
jgi:hypothetical protein